MAKAIEAGIPKMRIEEAAARTQARIDSGRQVIVGVNRYAAQDDVKIDVLKVDNALVRNKQLDKLARNRAERDNSIVMEKLKNLTRAAENNTGNLLELAVDAARVKLLLVRSPLLSRKFMAGTLLMLKRFLVYILVKLAKITR